MKLKTNKRKHLFTKRKIKTKNKIYKLQKNNKTKQKYNKLLQENKFLVKDIKKLERNNKILKSILLDNLSKNKIKSGTDISKNMEIIKKEWENKLIQLERNMLKDFLVILDTLELSLNYTNNIQNKEFLEGIQNTIKKFYQLLNKYGIHEIQHEFFDPNYHQAIGIETSNDKENNKILKVIQKGFIKNNKLIRPGLVIINKK